MGENASTDALNNLAEKIDKSNEILTKLIVDSAASRAANIEKFLNLTGLILELQKTDRILQVTDVEHNKRIMRVDKEVTRLEGELGKISDRRGFLVKFVLLALSGAFALAALTGAVVWTTALEIHKHPIVSVKK